MSSEDAQGSSEGPDRSELKKGTEPAGALTIFRQLGEERRRMRRRRRGRSGWVCFRVGRERSSLVK